MHSSAQLKKILAAAPAVNTFQLTFTQTRAVGGSKSVTTQTSLYDIPHDSYEVTELQSGKPTLNVIHTPSAQYERDPGKKWIKYILPAALIAPVRPPGQAVEDLLPPGGKFSSTGKSSYSISGSLGQVGSAANDIPSALSTLQGTATGTFTMTLALNASGLPLHEHDEVAFSTSTQKAVTIGDRTYSGYNTTPAVVAPSASMIAKTIRINSLAQLQSLEGTGSSASLTGAGTTGASAASSPAAAATVTGATVTGSNPLTTG